MPEGFIDLGAGEPVGVSSTGLITSINSTDGTYITGTIAIDTLDGTAVVYSGTNWQTLTVPGQASLDIPELTELKEKNVILEQKLADLEGKVEALATMVQELRGE